jgi:ketosteroid isomerase-like protein
MLTPTEVALEFVKRINARNVNKLCELMTEDHVFIDSGGNPFQGREMMRNAWNSYYEWFPDYAITVIDVLADGNVVGLFGSTSGTFAVQGELHAQNHWAGPAALKATIQGEQVAEWCVYADSDAITKIMDAAQR